MGAADIVIVCVYLVPDLVIQAVRSLRQRAILGLTLQVYAEKG